MAFWTEVSHYDIVESLLKHFSKLEIKHDNIRVSPVQITCFVVIHRQIFKTTCSVILKCKMYTLWDISFPLQVQQLKSKIFHNEQVNLYMYFMLLADRIVKCNIFVCNESFFLLNAKVWGRGGTMMRIAGMGWVGLGIWFDSQKLQMISYRHNFQREWNLAF